MDLKADLDRSMMRPRANGPRSLTRTTTLLAVLGIDDLDARTEGQGAVRRRQLALVEALAAGGFARLEFVAVIRGHAGLAVAAGHAAARRAAAHLGRAAAADQHQQRRGAKRAGQQPGSACRGGRWSGRRGCSSSCFAADYSGSAEKTAWQLPGVRLRRDRPWTSGLRVTRVGKGFTRWPGAKRSFDSQRSSRQPAQGLRKCSVLSRTAARHAAPAPARR